MKSFKNLLSSTTKRTFEKPVPCRRSSLSKEFSTLTLGARLENSKTDENESINKNHLYSVCFALFFCFSLVNILCYLVTTYGITASNLPNEEPSIQSTTTVNNDGAGAVSFMGDWFEKQLQSGEAHMLPSPRQKSTDSACVTEVKEEIERQGLLTSPAIFETMLERMGLNDRPILRDQLEPWLTYPRSVETTFQRLLGCIENSKPLHEVACVILDSSTVTNSWNATDSANNSSSVLEEAIHQAIILDRLTNFLMEDVAALHDVVEVMTTTHRSSQDAYYEEYFSESTRRRYANDYNDAAATLQSVASSIAENKSILMRTSLQISLLRGAHLDLEADNEANARVGMTLASAVHFEPTVQDHQLNWPLGADWADAYMTWIIGHQASAGTSSPMESLFASLALCSSARTDHAESFVFSQIILNSLIQMIQRTPSRLSSDDEEDVEASAFADMISNVNMKTVRLSSPSEESVANLLNELCTETNCEEPPQDQTREPGSWQETDTVPTSHFSDSQFSVYVGFILWFTVLFAGLGLELLTWTSFLHGGWTDERQSQWMFAQFSFPLLLATTLGLAFHRNFLALIFLVPGLWKFGFPETLVYMHTALYGTYLHVKGGSHAGRIQRFSEFLNAVGTVVHHGAAALIICMLLTGVIPASRHIYNPSLILVMQHWFVLLRYGNKILYTVIELSLEVFFEWTVISEFEYFQSMHWVVPMTAASMLVAHWLYLIAALVETLKLVTNDDNNADEDNDEDDPDRRESNHTQETKKTLIMNSSMQSMCAFSDMSDSHHEEEDIDTFEMDEEQRQLMCSLESLALDDIQEASNDSYDSGSSSSSNDSSDRAEEVCIDFREIKLLDLGDLEAMGDKSVGAKRVIDV